MKGQNDCQKKISKINKPRLRANGLSLLPLALRPGLEKVKKFYEKHFKIREYKETKQGYTFTIISIDFVLALVGLFLLQNSYVSNVSAASLTLSIPSTLSLNITDPSANGGFAKSSAATVSVKTDNEGGYTLSIKAKNNNELVNGSSKLTSISSAVSESDFSSKGTANTWGYLPSKLNSADNTSFQPGPTTAATTIDKTSVANASAANNYTFALAAKVNSSIPSGAYSNTFILTSTTNVTAYNITYNLDSGSWSGTSPQTGSTTGSNITLDSNTPTKSGYEFQGWCSALPSNNNSSSVSCPGNTYQPSASYPLSRGATATLYAMWKKTISYNINYECAGVSPIGGWCGSSSGATTESYVYLQKIEYGWNYTFEGWCTQSPSNNKSSSVSCPGRTYKSGATYPISGDTEVTLYAMWGMTPKCNGTVSSSSAKELGGKTWTTNHVTCNWWGANKACPSGFHLPTYAEFEALLAYYGDHDALRKAGWVGGYIYWSSTAQTRGGHQTFYKPNPGAGACTGGNDSYECAVSCVK